MYNIILIITDTFRYDNLGNYSKVMPVRTPELDRFSAERAVSIDGFYTGSFPTIPHRTDIATGRIGWTHFGWQPIDLSSHNHIAAILGEKGYQTQLICDCPHLFPARFQHRFTAAFQHRGQEGDKALLHLNDPIQNIMPDEKTRLHPSFLGRHLADLHRWHNRYWQYETQSFPAQTGNTTIRWLEENYKFKPFFLWVDFFDPHEPWDPPEYLVRRYDPEYAGIPMIHPNYGHTNAYTESELTNLRAHYCAEAELVDRWIGRILQKIDDLQLWDNTIVAITSDHGMSLGEHERTGKSNISDNDDRYWPLYPEIGHVPFIISAPEIPKGRSISMLGSPVDFLPTICDLAHIEVNPPEPFHGKSFANILREGSGKHREYIVSGCFVRSGLKSSIPNKASTPFIITEEWGYAPVGANGEPELYDIKSDPLAENDIAFNNEDIVQEMHKLFIDYLHEHNAPPECLNCWGIRPHRSADGSWARDYE